MELFLFPWRTTAVAFRLSISLASSTGFTAWTLLAPGTAAARVSGLQS
jgi:hypothetical protein